MVCRTRARAAALLLALALGARAAAAARPWPPGSAPLKAAQPLPKPPLEPMRAPRALAEGSYIGALTASALVRGCPLHCSPACGAPSDPAAARPRPCARLPTPLAHSPCCPARALPLLPPLIRA
jgi:hypothetical protein